MSLNLAKDIEIAWDMKDGRMFNLVVTREVMDSVNPHSADVRIIDWHSAGEFYFGFSASWGADTRKEVCVYVLTLSGTDNYRHIGYLTLDPNADSTPR